MNMRYVFLILAATTLLFATQPIWQTACQQLAESCSVRICEAQNTAPDEGPAQDCCPPFQCCFLSFPGFSTPYVLGLKEFFEKKTQPQAAIDFNHFQYVSDCFHPPEVAHCQ